MTFSILDHVDALIPNPKEKNKYFCPVCNGHNLFVDPNTGAYTCYNGCEIKDIREAISPWEERLKERQQESGYQPRNSKQVNKKPQPPEPYPIPLDPIELAFLPQIPSDQPQLINEHIPNFVVEKCGVPANAKVKTYQYSETQVIKRYQWDDDSKPKGYSKTIRPWHINDGEGSSPASNPEACETGQLKQDLRLSREPRRASLLKMGKGNQEWLPYRLNEAATHGQGKWVIGVEGENGVEDARSLGLPAVTWQGASWNEVDLGTGLTLLKNADVKGMIFISDNDETGEKKAKALLEVSGKVNFPVLVIPASKLWGECPPRTSQGGEMVPLSCPPKGDISDWIQWGKAQGMNTQDFIKRLEEQIQDSVKLRSLTKEINKRENFKEYIKNEIEEITIHYNAPQWGEQYLSDYLFKEYENQLLFECESKEWHGYSIESKGIWSEMKDEFLKQKLRYRLTTIQHTIALRNQELNDLKQEILTEDSLEDKEKKELLGSLPYLKSKEITSGFIERLAKHLSWLLLVKEMQRNHEDGLIPFKNGVLEVETKKLLPYKPDYLFTWQLPYDYNPLAKCDPIKQWLLETLGDESLVELIRAYFYGILTGRTDWQKYLKLLGVGGAGKGTIMRLAIALIGFNNCHSTTLRELETNKFETANIRNKRLILISEADDYVGSFNVLKALLGQDPLRKEIKNRQASTFIPEALVMMASNENIRSKDNTSGLARRRITIGFNQAVAPHLRRDLISFDRNNAPKGEFKDYIPGLLNWVLDIDPERATALIKDSDRQCTGLAKQKIETLMATNSLAAWLNENIVHDLDNQTFIGTALKSKDEHEVYLNADLKLYPNYCRFVEGAGLGRISLNKFRENLLDLLNHQLKLEGISDGKDRTFGKFIQGIRLRVDSDISPPLLEQVFLERDNRDDLRQPEMESETAQTEAEKAETAIVNISETYETEEKNSSTRQTQPKDKIEEDVTSPTEQQNKCEVIDPEKPSQPSQPSPTGFQSSPEVVTSRHQSSQEEPKKPEELDYNDIIQETDTHMKRLGWTVEQGQEYLINTYSKRSRQLLSDDELLEFLKYLRNLNPFPSP